MDDDIFMDLDVINAKKTYSNKLRKEPQLRLLPLNKKEVDDIEIPQPLTTKVAIKFLLEGRLKSKVCRYCLNITPGLSELDQIMKIGGTGNIYKVTIRDIIASFHPFKVVDDPNFPNKICQKCLDKALGAYLFTQQCERAERAMLNCFDDMYEKFEKLDPIDRPKKRGRQKLNPNFNILRAEHYRVIDYAEPIIHIVNVGAEANSKEPELNDLECKKCWQVLPNLESLINHEKIHPKTMWYHCRLCGKSFPKCNQLKRHNNRVHVLSKEPTPHPDKDFKCKECSHVTDNFIQHLQHVEKHKFRNIMQHLIEKRMDKLCVVCYNKGTKMMDLDKMVCIHGCHPDLMGDKTLYTLLATTLPNPKSYKYQDLCLPSKAQVMTISTKQNSYGKRKTNELKEVSKRNCIIEDFPFSYPIVISREKFKTDHFYFYVFCDPENQNDVYVMSDNITKTKVVEVVDICDIEIENLNPEISVSKEKTNVRTENIINNDLNVEDIAEYETIFSSGMPDVVAQEYEKKDNTFVTEITEVNLNIQNHKLSSPELVNDNYLKYINKLPNISQYIFSNPLHESSKECAKIFRLEVPETTVNQPNASQYKFSNPLYESVEEFDKSLRFELKENVVTESYNNKNLTQELCEKDWIFDNTVNDLTHNTATKSDENVKCKFCWAFKLTGFCGYCKMPIESVKENCKTATDRSTDKAQNKNKKQFEEDKNKIWQCSVCLINNNVERFTCQCCGTMKFTEHSDIKITFGNNKIFQRKETENKDNSFPKEIDNSIQLPSNDSNKITVTKEPSIMDCKSNSEDKNKLETVNVISMETDIATFKITTTTNDIEAMDVEESPTILNEPFMNKSPLLNFNIETMMSSMSTYPAAITPIIGTNLQFNMGCASKPKPLKKFKRIIRNMPKAFHK